MEDSNDPISQRQPDANDGARQFASGSVRYVVLKNGATITAGNSTEVFVRISGRGRILWPGGAEDSRDHRALGLFLVPPAGSLSVSGSVHGLRVELPNIGTVPPARPLSDVLIGLLCRRAWHGRAPAAEAAVALAGLLVLEETGQDTD